MGQCLLWAELVDASFSLCFPKRQGLCLLLWLLSSIGKMAQEQLCRYVTIFQAKNPWMYRTGSLAGLASELGCGATWTAGPGLPPLSPAWLLLGTGPSATSSEAQILKQLSGQLGPQGP